MPLGPSRGFANPCGVWFLGAWIKWNNMEGKCAVSDTTLAILALHPWDVGGLSLATSSHPGHYPEPYQSGAHNKARGPNASHMACLSGIPSHHEEFLHKLQSYSSHYGKTKLTVASCSSLLSKWASCCEQRNRDPIVEPVEDVAYLLVGLHAEGYQYRSLIAYHSAISSIHEWVEQSIRQHPLVSRIPKGVLNRNPPKRRY